MEVFIARQPIFDRSDRLHGYELLYRNSAGSTTAEGAAADTMCTETVINSFLGIGLDDLTDGVPAFVNCTREFLLESQVDLLPAGSVVVEILENVGTDAAVVAACSRLRAHGYTLALDDFVDGPGMDSLLRVAAIVKLDVLDRDVEAMAPLLDRLRGFGVQLLAERVETNEVRDQCMRAGFDLFQGYFYQRPEMVVRQEVEVNHGAMLRLMDLLRDPDRSEAEIERGFRADPALAYKLLRIVNSAAVGGRNVDSIGYAIRIVGRQMLYRWLALILVSSMVTGNDVEDQLVFAALLRARLCEVIAESSPYVSNSQALFMTGLFSMLNHLLRMPMRELFARVSVSDEIREAVMNGTGPCADPLLLADAYQRGDWERVDTLAPSLGVQSSQLPWLYTKSLAWVNEQLLSTSDKAASPAVT